MASPGENVGDGAGGGRKEDVPEPLGAAMDQLAAELGPAFLGVSALQIEPFEVRPRSPQGPNVLHIDIDADVEELFS
jgi:hypothetical protein